MRTLDDVVCTVRYEIGPTGRLLTCSVPMVSVHRGGVVSRGDRPVETISRSNGTGYKMSPDVILDFVKVGFGGRKGLRRVSTVWT